MTGDHAGILALQQFSGSPGNVPMARAMKTPTLDVILITPLDRRRVIPQAIGHRGMKTGFKRGHQGNPRQLLGQESHGGNVRRIVSRRDVVHLLHRCQDAGIHPLHATDPTPMHGLKADGGHLRGIAQATVNGIGQLFEALADSHRMVRHMGRQLRLPSVNLHDARTLRRSNPLDTTPRHLTLRGHVEQPVLKTGRAEVGNQDLHDRHSRGIRSV